MEIKSSSIIEVMVIDDQPELKKHVKKILEDAGFNVFWVRSWKDAEKELFKRSNLNLAYPDVILVDMHFDNEFRSLSTNPALEGILIIRETIKMFQKLNAKCPAIIGFTGKLDYIEAETIIKFGAHDFITEAEYRRSNYFIRRLIQSIIESQFDNAFKPFDECLIEDIEEEIVQKLLSSSRLNEDTLNEYLNWPNEIVTRVIKRLGAKGML